jgi:hypothetical protein
MRVTCSAHLILLDLLTFIIFGEAPTHYEASHCEIFLRFLLSLPSYVMKSYNETFLKSEVTWSPLESWIQEVGAKKRLDFHENEMLLIASFSCRNLRLAFVFRGSYTTYSEYK